MEFRHLLIKKNMNDTIKRIQHIKGQLVTIVHIIRQYVKYPRYAV